MAGAIWEGATYVVDDCDDIAGSVGAGIGEQLYDGRIHSYPVGDCHCRGAGQDHTRATSPVGTQAASQVVGRSRARAAIFDDGNVIEEKAL
jgi:hypothetical protein